MKQAPDQLPMVERLIIQRGYPLLFFLMALTGFAQMPIFKRYYLADLPGLGWLAQYFVTHTMHYVGATILLTMTIYCAMVYLVLLRKQYRLTRLAKIRILLLVGVVITGVFRVLKNLPTVVFSPEFTMLIDIAHLLFMLLYLLVAALALLSGTGWLTATHR